MLSRLLPPPVIKFTSDGQITATKRVIGQIANVALTQAVNIRKSAKTADDPLELLEQGHEAWRELRDAIPQLEKLSVEILNASETLNGVPPTHKPDSAVGELAFTTEALKSQIEIADPEADLSDVDDIADLLKQAADAIAADADIARNRLKKLDTHLRAAVGEAITRSDLSAADVEHIFDEYETPEHWEASIHDEADDIHTIAISTFKEKNRESFQNHLRNLNDGLIAPGTERKQPPFPKYGDAIRSAARQLSILDKNTQRERKNKLRQERQASQKNNLTQRAAEIWEAC